MLKILTPALFAAACSLGLSSADAADNPEASLLPAETTQRMDAHLEAIADLYGTAGYSVAILMDDQLVHTHHGGHRNIEAGLPTNGDTTYTIWSMSKLFFNIEVLRAIETGEIQLDETLGDVFDALPADWQDVTLRQAWSHMSGLPDFVATGFPPDADAALSAATAAEIPAEAGSESRYNQTNFLLLGQHLERVTGTPYLDLVRRNQIEALSLTHTSFSPEAAGADQALNYRSSRHDPSELAVIEPPVWPDYVYTSVGMQASLNDMVVWSQALVRGELGSRTALIDLWQPQTLADGTIAEHAHGWEIEMRGDVTAVGHGGGGRVNLRHYFHPGAPEHSLTIIYLDNGGLLNFNHRGLSARLADMVWPGVANAEEHATGALAEAAGRSDVTAAAHAFQAHADATPDPAGRRERELNRIGYAALRLHGPDVAIPVFELEARYFPDSWNSQDSLGEAYYAAGRLREAREQYQRALDLNPQSPRIEAILADLDAEIAAAGH